MWWKALGACLIVAASSGVAMGYVEREKRRLREIWALVHGITLVKTRLQQYGMPLGMLFLEVGERIGTTIGQIFLEVGEGLLAKQEASAQIVWSRIWEKEGGRTALALEDLNELEAFGRGLSQFSKEEREGSMALLLFYLQEKQGQLQKRLEQHVRLYYSVGVICGLFVAIVLY